ncbi:MAG: hypothetical protein LUD14_06550 [Clostridiales bacterium]|nr:hypothetical protein [Clostridiales bacterium]
MESSVERTFYDLVIDCNEVRFSAMILNSATDEEIEEIRNLAQKIAKRWQEAAKILSKHPTTTRSEKK